MKEKLKRSSLVVLYSKVQWLLNTLCNYHLAKLLGLGGWGGSGQEISKVLTRIAPKNIELGNDRLIFSKYLN